MEERRCEPVEITKEKAYIAYILTGNRSAASRLCGANHEIIKHWIETEDWETSRQDYYDEVHKHASEFLHENLATKQAEIAVKAMAWLEDMMVTDLRDAEGGTKLDLWKAFETGVNAVEKLLGMASGEKKESGERQPLIQLSGEGQKIYLQSIQKLGIINAGNTESLRRDKKFGFAGEREREYSRGREVSLPTIDQDESEE